MTSPTAEERAREVCILHFLSMDGPFEGAIGCGNCLRISGAIRAAEAAARAEEREACAAFVMEQHERNFWSRPHYDCECEEIAAAIRARGEGE